MLLDPRTPYAVGAVLVCVICGILLRYDATPGDLASPHGRIEGMSTWSGCQQCHGDAGLSASCLDCHTDVAIQLAEDKGYHHHLIGDEDPGCARCHAEHRGKDFPLVSELSWGPQVPAAFGHPHVEFGLDGAHEKVSCEVCHFRGPDDLPAAPSADVRHTFLGLTQECASCHDDIHTDGVSGACETCHGQESFVPTRAFDHGEHLPLSGGHGELDCDACHHLGKSRLGTGEFPFPFDRTRGTACVDCHASPHVVDFGESCEECHQASDPAWVSAMASMTPARHENTGFSLESPHGNVDCAACHSRDLPFAERHTGRDPESCHSCHADAHDGQFGARQETCLDCHRESGFQPTAFGHEAHEAVFPLTGSHAAVACIACHETDATTGARRFAGTPRACKSCHEDIHAGQFRAEILTADCHACHDPTSVSFALEPFDHEAKTTYALDGAHARAACESCHIEQQVMILGDGIESRVVTANRYRGTPDGCDGCHQDAHRGQSAEYGGCESCHTSFSFFKHVDFDHDTRSRFPLEGAHAETRCSNCHVPTPTEGGVSVISFKPLGTECRDCHEIDEIPDNR